MHREVKPTGSRFWRFRSRFNGTPNMLGLGEYPSIGLNEARCRRDAARKQIAEGSRAIQDRLDAERERRLTRAEVRRLGLSPWRASDTDRCVRCA